MKKVKHISVGSSKYPKDINIFKLSRYKTKGTNIYQIQGSPLDKQWTKKGLEVMASLTDDGGDVYISAHGDAIWLGYDGIEELRLLLNYYQEHTNTRHVNARIRSKK